MLLRLEHPTGGRARRDDEERDTDEGDACGESVPGAAPEHAVRIGAAIRTLRQFTPVSVTPSRHAGTAARRDPSRGTG
jgi:hypothetical protein